VKDPLGAEVGTEHLSKPESSGGGDLLPGGIVRPSTVVPKTMGEILTPGGKVIGTSRPGVGENITTLDATEFAVVKKGIAANPLSKIPRPSLRTQ
jgi:hypothetical protein